MPHTVESCARAQLLFCRAWGHADEKNKYISEERRLFLSIPIKLHCYADDAHLSPSNHPTPVVSSRVKQLKFVYVSKPPLIKHRFFCLDSRLLDSLVFLYADLNKDFIAIAADFHFSIFVYTTSFLFRLCTESVHFLGCF